jgi:hypothetical protein
MSEQPEIREIAQNLASVEPKIRQKGLKNLKTVLHQTTPDQFPKICLGLFYFYWYSDGLDSQMADRAAICGLLDLVRKEDKFAWLETFMATLIDLWDGVDYHRTDKFLKLLREWFTSVYTWLNSLQESKKVWVQWNDYLSTNVLFNYKCELISCPDCPAISVRPARHFRQHRV